MNRSILALGFLAFTAPATLAQAPQDLCMRLEAQLSALDQQNAPPADLQRYEDAIARQQYELDRTVAMARGMGCGQSFLFGPAPPPQCDQLDNRIDRMQANLERLTTELQRARGSDGAREARRQQLMAALSQNRCGSGQYQAGPPPQDNRRGGLFGLLFGNGGGGGEAGPGYGGAAPGGEMMPGDEAPHSSTVRTVCVRTCDGFFFPINYATNSSRLEQDAAICKRTCPGTEATLYAYPTGGDISQASSVNGEPYSKLPNAFKYQKEYVPNCSCKPANMSWSDALSGSDDKTLRKGDIVVDEARSRQMSRPKNDPNAPQSVSPSEAGQAAREAAQDTATETAPVEEAPTPAEASDPNESAPVRSVGPTFFPKQ